MVHADDNEQISIGRTSRGSIYVYLYTQMKSKKYTNTTRYYCSNVFDVSVIFKLYLILDFERDSGLIITGVFFFGSLHEYYKKNS